MSNTPSTALEVTDNLFDIHTETRVLVKNRYRQEKQDSIEVGRLDLTLSTDLDLYINKNLILYGTGLAASIVALLTAVVLSNLTAVIVFAASILGFLDMFVTVMVDKVTYNK